MSAARNPHPRPSRTSSRAIRRTLVSLGVGEGRFRTLFAVVHEPILLVSAEARVTGFNDAAVSLFGTARRLYGRRIQLLMPFVSAAS
jgi:PAS domain-containing protein